MNYRFLNVYDAMRLDGLKYFDPPKVLFPKGLQVTTISKDTVLELTESQLKNLEQGIRDNGKGALKIVLEHRDELTIFSEKDIKEEAKKFSEEFVEKAERNIDKIVSTSINNLQSKKNINEAKTEYSVALSLIDKEVYDRKIDMDMLYEKLRRKKEKIREFKSGERSSLAGLDNQMSFYDLYTFKETQELIDFHIDETIKNEGIHYHELAIKNEQKIIDRYEVKISQSNVKKLLKLINPKPAKEIKYGISLINKLGIPIVNYFQNYSDCKLLISSATGVKEITLEGDLFNGLNIMFVRYGFEKNKRPILIMKYRSVSREKYSSLVESQREEREKNIQSTLENTKLYKENMEHRKKEEIYNITADQLKKNLKKTNEVGKEIKYGVSLTNKMGMFSSQTFKEYKEVIFFIYEATGAIKSSIPTMKQLMYDENVIPIKYGGEEIYRPIIIRKY